MTAFPAKAHINATRTSEGGPHFFFFFFCCFGFLQAFSFPAAFEEGNFMAVSTCCPTTYLGTPFLIDNSITEGAPSALAWPILLFFFVSHKNVNRPHSFLSPSQTGELEFPFQKRKQNTCFRIKFRPLLLLLLSSLTIAKCTFPFGWRNHHTRYCIFHSKINL